MRYIVGIGNYSMYDDSIGIRITEYLIENNMEDGFRVLDLSSNILNIFSYLNKETDLMLIIDTANLNKPAGEYLIFNLNEVETQKNLSGFSTHEGDIIKTLNLAQKMNYYIPEIKIMGIQPLEIKNEFGLSDILASKLSIYAEKALLLLK